MMNRRNRILVGAIVVQLIIAVIVFLPTVTLSSAPSAPLFGDLKASDIVGVTVQDNTSNSIELANQNGAWVLPQSDSYPASATKIEAFLTKVVGFTTNPLVTRTSNSHARLQVADTAFVRKVDLKLADGTARTLFIGSASSGSATYVRLGGHDEVYLARNFNSYEAGADATTWVDPVYLSVPQDKIVAATLQNANGTFDFVKDAANLWTLKGLSSTEQPNTDAVATLLSRLNSIQLLKPLGKEAKPEYGLDKPGAVVTAVVSDTGGLKTYTLRVGAKDASGDYTIISSESPYYVQVAGFNVDQFETQTRAQFLAAPTPAPTVAPTAIIPPTIEATPIATPTLPITSTVAPTATEPLTVTPTLTATLPITTTATPAAK
jgi:hypothetical protein